MRKEPDTELIDDDENPEWTAETMKRAVPFSGLPIEMQRALLSIKKRGPQKAPTKQMVSLRLSREVVSYFKSKGKGWQTRIDEVLKTAVAKGR